MFLKNSQCIFLCTILYSITVILFLMKIKSPVYSIYVFITLYVSVSTNSVFECSDERVLILHEPWGGSSFLWYLAKVELSTPLINLPFILRVGCDILEIRAGGAQVRHNYADGGLSQAFSMKSGV